MNEFFGRGPNASLKIRKLVPICMNFGSDGEEMIEKMIKKSELIFHAKY